MPERDGPQGGPTACRCGHLITKNARGMWVHLAGQPLQAAHVTEPDPDA